MLLISLVTLEIISLRNVSLESNEIELFGRFVNLIKLNRNFELTNFKF